MPFIPMDEYAKVILNWQSVQNNHAMNIIWVRSEAGGYTSIRLDALLDVVSAWATAEWSPIASDQWELDLITAQSWDVENGLIEQQLPSVLGALTSPAAPSTTTIAVSLRTGQAGRSYRGRLYHVGLTEQACIGDFIDTGAGANIVAAYEQLRLDLTLADFTWCVASFFTNGAPRLAGVGTPISDIILTNIALDTMRSRHAN